MGPARRQCRRAGAARSKLVGLLDANARDTKPEIAAHAQGSFDCWVEQQEENFQPDHIATCRDQYYAAIAQLEEQPAPAAAEAAPMMAPETYTVYFDFNKDNIKPEAAQVLDKVIADAAKQAGLPAISATGHTDLVGPEEYNLALSLRRADAVRNYLIKGGIAADRITVSGRGEAEPAVPTPRACRRHATVASRSSSSRSKETQFSSLSAAPGISSGAAFFCRLRIGPVAVAVVPVVASR